MFQIFMQKKISNQTLNRDPIEENFEDFDVSSGSGGNKPDTNGHLEALSKS